MIKHTRVGRNLLRADVFRQAYLRKHIEAQASQPGLPIVRLTLKTHSPATVAAWQLVFAFHDSLGNVVGLY